MMFRKILIYVLHTIIRSFGVLIIFAVLRYQHNVTLVPTSSLELRLATSDEARAAL